MPGAPYNANVLMAAVIALSAATTFVALLHLYGRWCLLQRRASAAAAAAASDPHAWRRPASGYEIEISVRAQGGMDAKDLRALPAFVCKGGEGPAPAPPCAVCLGEVADGELARLLPACRHVFHAQCIDTWLSLSSTCPVCRMKVTGGEAKATATATADMSAAS